MSAVTDLPFNVTDLRSQVQTRIVNVTPPIAEEWLGRNQRNRNVRQRVVAQYARDMQAGKWQMTGEPVSFDTAGRLINGQHRADHQAPSPASRRPCHHRPLRAPGGPGGPRRRSR